MRWIRINFSSSVLTSSVDVMDQGLSFLAVQLVNKLVAFVSLRGRPSILWGGGLICSGQDCLSNRRDLPRIHSFSSLDNTQTISAMALTLL